MMETGCMANYDGDRLYSNTIMKNIVWRTVVLNCTTETWSAYKYDSCGHQVRFLWWPSCTGTILVVADLYLVRFWWYKYDSCGGRLVPGTILVVQVRFLWWPTCTRYDSCGTSTILVVADLYQYDSCDTSSNRYDSFGTSTILVVADLYQV